MNEFKGVYTALITPFRNGKLDMKSMEQLIQFQVNKGIRNFVVNGTTGESPTTKDEEVKQMFDLVKKQTPTGGKVFLGTGLNSTEKTIEETKKAEQLGADAALVVVPYYNKPPQRGLVAHFSAVASASKIPIVLYNVPSRTITSMDIDTVVRLSHHRNILGIKEASGNIDLARSIRSRCGDKFLLLSGDDGTYDEFMRAGGDGVISVCSHIIPQAMLETKATKHAELIRLLFIEANPIPVKAALKLMGIIDSAELRLPLVELEDTLLSQLKKEMLKVGLVK